MLLFIPIAAAGWTESARENDCVFYLGSVEGTVQPVRAECDWPISADEIQRYVADTGAHDDYFAAVKECTVLGSGPGGTTLAYQVHTASGISDREVVLAFSKASIPGGTRYAWTMASDQSGAKGDLVPVALDTGMWEITSTATGSRVVYELRYDAGGSVPGFLVRWFQGTGVRTLVGELRTWAEKH